MCRPRRGSRIGAINLGVGDLYLDLRNVRLPVGETKLTTASTSAAYA